MGTTIAKLIKITEKALLAIIALLTILATCEEVLKIYHANSVQLADLLLLFFLLKKWAHSCQACRQHSRKQMPV